MMKIGVALSFLVIASIFIWANWPAQIVEFDNVDLVVVNKSERLLELYSGGNLLKTFQVSLGGNPIGAKRTEGDKRTPEGNYILDYHKANSSFHRAIHISYPSVQDIAYAQSRNIDPGDLIMIHGLPNGLGFIGKLHRVIDWTDGCIAVTNTEIKQIFASVTDGTRIIIKP